MMYKYIITIEDLLYCKHTLNAGNTLVRKINRAMVLQNSLWEEYDNKKRANTVKSHYSQ